MRKEIPPSPTEQSETRDPAPARDCELCAITSAMDGATLCADCAAMYGTVSARAVPGLCDCGHPAEGSRVYLYRKDGTRQTLCGKGCVRRHFQETFRFFLGTPRSMR